MNKTFLIFRHEFIHQLKRTGFIVMTLVFPLVGLVAIGIVHIVQISGGEQAVTDIQRIGYVDEAGGFDEYSSDLESVKLVPYPDRGTATNALLNKDIDEYFIIPIDYLQSGIVMRYVTEKELEMPGQTYRTIRAFLQTNLLKEQVNTELMERVKYPLGVRSIRLDDTGEIALDQGGFSTFLLPMTFGFLLIIAIGASSGYLLQGLGEEKENRIMEILVSSVSPRQLLVGKIIGLGAAGLIQIIFWLLTFVLISQLASGVVGGPFTNIQVSNDFIILGIVYFILGYLFFAIMIAGIGAISGNPKETPQISVAFILPAILPFYIAIIFLRENPDHFIGTILTLIPVTAPMSVFVRLGMSEIATWELILSIFILIVSIIGAVLLAAKTFRVFLLMYGKTPKLKEILRLIRQA
jgi:ABC-2 type transport system permease protein